MSKKGDESPILKTQNSVKFLQRFKVNVKDKYLYSPAELNSNIRTLSLFTKFDADGSGALDARELAKLYRANGVMVSEKEI